MRSRPRPHSFLVPTVSILLRSGLLVLLGAACHEDSRGQAQAREAFANARKAFALENPQEAIALMQRAVELDPAWAEARLALGKLLVTFAEVRFSTATLDRGRLGQAIEALEKACALEPDNVEAAYWTGHALRKADRHPEAVQRFEATLALRPDHGLATKELGLLYAEDGDAPRSIEYLERARALLPKDDEILFQLGLQLESEERLEEARDAYLAAAARNTGHPGPRSRLIWLYRRLGDEASSEHMQAEFDRCRAFGKRITAASQYFDEHSREPEACMGLAELYREIGMQDAAVNWAERALRLDRNHGPAVALLEELGQPVRAPGDGLDQGLSPAPRDGTRSREEQ